jgi:pilus assembly protein CpaF
MATLNNSDLRIIPPIARASRPVPLRVSQQIKTTVHQELIRRMDLETISQMQENRESQQQLLVVILQLIDEQ